MQSVATNVISFPHSKFVYITLIVPQVLFLAHLRTIINLCPLSLFTKEIYQRIKSKKM